jgi:hypothetical protein
VKAYLALAACLFTAPASAQSSVCNPLDVFVEQQLNRGAVVRPVSGPAASAAVALYNMTPPQSNNTYDLVVAVEKPDGSAAFHYGNAGTICTFLAIAPNTWAKIRARFFGQST